MSDTNAVNDHVWPSQNDVAPNLGEGKTWLEIYHKALNIGLAIDNYVLSGGTLPASDTDLTCLVSAGSGIIDGRLVEWDQTTITLPNNQTNHIYVCLNKASSLVNNLFIRDNTTAAIPADSLKLGTVTTSGGVITTSTDMRLLRRNYKLARMQQFTVNTTWRAPEGITEVHVICQGGGGGGGGGGGSVLNDPGSNQYAGPGHNGQRGGNGALTYTNVTVTPGTNYTVTIGSAGSGGGGGAAGTGGSGGTDGGNTTFDVLGFAGGGRGGHGGNGGHWFTTPWTYGTRGSAGGSGSAGLGGGGGGGEGASVSGSDTPGNGGDAGNSGHVTIFY